MTRSFASLIAGFGFLLTQNAGIATATLVGANGLIAFQTNRDDPFHFEIYVMNANGGGQTNLTKNPADDGYPAWSPDGSRIAFSSTRDGTAQIYVMNADGSGVIRITTTPGISPVWSPDGSRIAFARFGQNFNWDIWVMNVDGSGEINLTNNPAEDILPSWSPTADQIAFQTNRDSNTEIYRVNADGGGLANLTNSPSTEDAYPKWSPDGLRIVFASCGGSPCQTSAGFGPDIFVMNADGSGRTNLTNSFDSDFMPAWSPDGSKIVFTSHRDFNDEIYVMNADGSGQTRLTNNAPPGNTIPEDWFADWQPLRQAAVPEPATLLLLGAGLAGLAGVTWRRHHRT